MTQNAEKKRRNKEKKRQGAAPSSDAGETKGEEEKTEKEKDEKEGYAWAPDLSQWDIEQLAGPGEVHVQTSGSPDISTVGQHMIKDFADSWERDLATLGKHLEESYFHFGPAGRANSW